MLVFSFYFILFHSSVDWLNCRCEGPFTPAIYYAIAIAVRFTNGLRTHFLPWRFRFLREKNRKLKRYSNSVINCRYEYTLNEPLLSHPNIVDRWTSWFSWIYNKAKWHLTWVLRVVTPWNSPKCKTWVKLFLSSEHCLKPSLPWEKK